MTIEQLTWLALGLATVCFGGEAFVRGTANLFGRIGVRPLLIGTLVVAFSSDSPEIASALRATGSDFSDLALGTLLGSTIFTILFVLGNCSLLLPARVSHRLVRQDAPILLAASLVVFLLSVDGWLSRIDGLLLLVGLAAFIFFVVRKSRSEREEIKRTYEHEYSQEGRGEERVRGVLFLLLGIGMLWLGSTWLVDAAMNIGRGIGVTDLVMGLTILGIGTSTPETATAISAILRGERELGIEHIISSSIFNILGGLSLVVLWTPGGLELPTSALRLDLPVLIAAAAGCLPVFVLGRLLPRWGGAVSITLYIAYVTYLVMNATRHGEEGVPGRTIAFLLIGLALGQFLVVILRSLVFRGRGPAEQDSALSDEAN